MTFPPRRALCRTPTVAWLPLLWTVSCCPRLPGPQTFLTGRAPGSPPKRPAVARRADEGDEQLKPGEVDWEETADIMIERLRDIVSIFDPGMQHKIEVATKDLEVKNSELKSIRGEISKEKAARQRAEEIAKEMGLRVEQLEADLEMAERTGKQIVETLKKQMDKLEADLMVERARNEEMKLQTDALQESYSDIADQLEFSEIQSKSAERTAEEKAEKLKNAEAKIASLTEKLGVSRVRGKQLKRTAEERTKQLSEAEERIDELSGRLEESSVRGRLLQTTAEERGEQLRDAEDRVVELSDRLQSADARARKAEVTSESRSELLLAAEETLSHLSEKVAFSEAHMAKLEKTVAERANLLKAAEARLNGVRSSMGAAAQAMAGKLKKKNKGQGFAAKNKETAMQEKAPSQGV